MEILTETSPPKANHIERIVAIINRDDRFKLFNDAAVAEGNLDNPIHPIFHPEQFLKQTIHIKQALQLASLYLTVPSLVEFFIPPTFGQIQKEEVDTIKTRHCIYRRKRNISRKKEIEIVLANLRCLAHHNTWEWADFSKDAKLKKTWGCTMLTKDVPVSPHNKGCPSLENTNSKFMLTPRTSTHIRIDEKMIAYYKDEEFGYATRSRCEQFRYDFQAAMVMCHEISHAYGGLILGSFKEPYLHRKHPINELGFAWENYMFGGRLDPPQKTSPESMFHLHKVWQNKAVLQRFAGEEYIAVPVAWTAQWFRKDTWEAIRKYGYEGVSQLPETTFKIYWSSNMRRHIVYTDDEDARNDLRWGRDSSALSYLTSKGGFAADADVEVARAFGMPMTGLAKMSLVPTPPRHFDDTPENDKPYLLNNQHRDFETWRALKAAKEELKKPNMLSVATKSMPTPSLVNKPKSVRRLRRLSVAGGPMSSSDSDLSPTFPKGWNTDPDTSDFISNKFIGERPEYYFDSRRGQQTTSTKSSTAYTSSTSSSLGKRSRNNDRSDVGTPSKKPRYDN